MAERVLIVDDEETHREVTRVVLEAAGYQIQVATDAGEARAALAEDPPDLVLVDLRLPDGDGAALIGHLRSLRTTPAPKLVAFTASAGREVEARALAAGFDGYIAKPIDSVGLLKRVAGHLREIKVGSVR